MKVKKTNLSVACDGFQLYETNQDKTYFITGKPVHDFEYYQNMFRNCESLKRNFANQNQFDCKSVSENTYDVTRKYHLSTKYFEIGKYSICEKWSVDSTDTKIVVTARVIPPNRTNDDEYTSVEKGTSHFEVTPDSITCYFQYDVDLNEMMINYFSLACFKVFIKLIG